jgi:hypothetical protein
VRAVNRSALVFVAALVAAVAVVVCGAFLYGDAGDDALGVDRPVEPR